MDYKFEEIEPKWQKFWSENKTFKVENKSDKPKFYILDMFPYPSGAGLHVGHPLGYIASDIYSRYMRLKGYNVLHPMGYDSFGLPAEQYAIQTGQHPAITTETNIKRYREQLDKIGFSFDWDREVRTSDPNYYKWTQWIFKQLFNSWYNLKSDKAENIETLIEEFKKAGNKEVEAVCSETPAFSAEDWAGYSEKEQQELLLNYRLAYLSDVMVNWCPGLGTVLANEEVINGVSERGGYPVERKLMRQWSMRITAYAERLLQGLDKIDWSDALKEMQRNWIGKSQGAEVDFSIKGHEEAIKVFTTRPDTIFGVTFMVLAPEHELVEKITTAEQKEEVEKYVEVAKNRSERERMTEVKRVSGVFTGAYVEHPFTGEDVPIWVGDYVLAGYGTGAIMAVPSGDQRDWNFATHFGLPIVPVIDGSNIEVEANETKEGILINSDFLNGLQVPDAIKLAVEKIEEKGIGTGKINYRLRDAIFSRQRYWGEPFPVYYKDGVPYMLEDSELPVTLPEVDKYLPTETGEPPLARAENWTTKEGYTPDYNTMPGWAGSSWYYLRYMDSYNEKDFVSKEAVDYWQQVDLYFGGAEHATGHLLYVRFWTMFLKDMGYLNFDEPAKKLINQGMIQGMSAIAHRINNTNTFVSAGLKQNYETTPIHVDVNLVDGNELDVEGFKSWLPEFKTAELELENGKFIVDQEVEKMSKRWHNVVNPDDIIDQYGADTLRMYEMFLGPLEQAKPWDTKGIEGVYRFLRKFWRLFHAQEAFEVSGDEPTKDELKVLHKTIKKIQEDIERMSFNTSVSAFMIATNELADLKCNKKAILEPMCVLIAPFAPHIAEELWEKLGNTESITYAQFPEFNKEYLVEDSFSYPISFNGKTRFTMEIPLNIDKAEVERMVIEAEQVKKYLEGKSPKKVIVVPNRIVNIVI